MAIEELAKAMYAAHIRVMERYGLQADTAKTFEELGPAGRAGMEGEARAALEWAWGRRLRDEEVERIKEGCVGEVVAGLRGIVGRNSCWEEDGTMTRTRDGSDALHLLRALGEEVGGE